MDGKFEKMERLKKTIDKVAYASLVLDICIAIVTSLSIFNVGNPQNILVPINYMLTIIVVLSIGLFITLFVLKHEEDIMSNLLNMKYRYKPNSRSFSNKIKRSFFDKIKHRIE